MEFCLPQWFRKGKLNKKYLKECKKLNPAYNKKDLADIKRVLKDLIYPDIKVQICNALLKEESGKTYVTVASVNID